MAAGGNPLVDFVCANQTAFYFRDHDNDVDEDGFLFKRASPKWIKSNNNKFLILNDSAEFQAQHLSTAEQERHPENKFNIHYYMNSDRAGAIGVALFAWRDGKKLAACCSDALEVHPVEMDVPNTMAVKKHKALFYLTKVAQSCFLLEASAYPSMFLAFEPDAADHTLSKLVLRHKEADQVDDSCCITML